MTVNSPNRVSFFNRDYIELWLQLTGLYANVKLCVAQHGLLVYCDHCEGT